MYCIFNDIYEKIIEFQVAYNSLLSYDVISLLASSNKLREWVILH